MSSPEIGRANVYKRSEKVGTSESLRDPNSFVIFAGQGQNLDQLRAKSLAFMNGNAVARLVYEDCDMILRDSKDFGERFKKGLREVLLDGTEEELKRNQQLIVLVYNLACSEMLKANLQFPNRKNILAFSGQSLGLLSAIHESGAIDRRNLLKLGVMRQEAMLKANEEKPGTLIAVLAASDDQRVGGLKKRYGLQTSIQTASGLVVLGGEIKNVDEAKKQTEIKLRIIPLNTDGAFHTEFMDLASKELAKRINEIAINDAEIPVISNTEAKEIRTSEAIRDEIVRQINNPVLWNDIANHLTIKADQVLEIGTDGMLTGHMQRELENRTKEKGKFPKISLTIGGIAVALAVGAILVIHHRSSTR